MSRKPRVRIKVTKLIYSTMFELDRIENLTSIKKTTLKNQDNLKYKNYSITPKK